MKNRISVICIVLLTSLSKASFGQILPTSRALFEPFISVGGYSKINILQDSGDVSPLLRNRMQPAFQAGVSISYLLSKHYALSSDWSLGIMSNGFSINAMDMDVSNNYQVSFPLMRMSLNLKYLSNKINRVILGGGIGGGFSGRVDNTLSSGSSLNILPAAGSFSQTLILGELCLDCTSSVNTLHYTAYSGSFRLLGNVMYYLKNNNLLNFEVSAEFYDSTKYMDGEYITTAPIRTRGRVEGRFGFGLFLKVGYVFNKL